MQTLLRCPYTRVRNRMHYICAYVKDPVINVRVRWIVKTLKHPACTVGWIARLCCSWLSPGKATQWEIPIGTIQLLKEQFQILVFCSLNTSIHPIPPNIIETTSQKKKFCPNCWLTRNQQLTPIAKLDRVLSNPHSLPVPSSHPTPIP